MVKNQVSEANQHNPLELGIFQPERFSVRRSKGFLDYFLNHHYSAQNSEIYFRLICETGLSLFSQALKTLLLMAEC